MAQPIVVHTPIHASWLNQVEIYFSIVQRKVLTPNDFNSLTALEDRLLDFQDHYQAVAKPFQWSFTRRDLAALLEKARRSPQGRMTGRIRHRTSGLEYLGIPHPRRGFWRGGRDSNPRPPTRQAETSGKAASVALSRLLREGLVDAPEGALRGRL